MFRKILKFCAYGIGGLVTLIAIFALVAYGVSNSRMHKRYAIQVSSVSVPNGSEAIERGRHIVAMRACADCHGADFGGAKVIDDPAAGVFWGANLTRGAGGLPADYSDLDYVRAIRHGLRRDGTPLVLMPSQEYSEMTDEDLGAVVAYLKSLTPVDRPRGPISPGPVIRALLVLGKVNFAAEQIDHNARRQSTVQVGATRDYGKYLATSCTGCHGPNLSGGKITGAPPDWPAAANLTTHASTNVSHWSEEQFIQTLRTHQRPDGTELNAVMPAAFKVMTDIELKALWAYISSLPASPTGAR